MNIHVHIERVVLEGSSPTLLELESDVEAALIRALESSPWPADLRGGDRFPGAAGLQATESRARPLGERIGDAIHAAMSGELPSFGGRPRMREGTDGYPRTMPSGRGVLP